MHNELIASLFVCFLNGTLSNILAELCQPGIVEEEALSLMRKL